MFVYVVDSVDLFCCLLFSVISGWFCLCGFRSLLCHVFFGNLNDLALVLTIVLHSAVPLFVTDNGNLFIDFVGMR